jgi:hypothetical protein
MTRIFLYILFTQSFLLAQSQSQYTGSNVTGQLALTHTVNVRQAAQSTTGLSRLSNMIQNFTGPDFNPNAQPKRLAPAAKTQQTQIAVSGSLQSGPAMRSLEVNPGTSSFGFTGITHYDQRTANGGNQFSVEPPSQGLAVGSGYVVEAVNDAYQVYSESGVPLLPAAISTNQLFGLAPAVTWATGTYGVFLADIRVYYDQYVNRWFVVQRSHDNDAYNGPLNSSHLYIAVSQTSDPTGNFNIYVMDATNSGHYRCPCFPDYPQVGADQFGFYVAVNQYGTYYNNFVDSYILAISKAALASGNNAPKTMRFDIPASNQYGFAIQPAAAPPGANNFVASGGVEYFVSSNYNYDSNLAVWAMSNTSSLATENPNPLLVQITTPTLAYSSPDVAIQRSGPLPYGSSLAPKGLLSYLDGNDTRILSLTYSGGRLYTTLATAVVDENGRQLVGGAYVILSPVYRGATLAAPVLRQGYLLTKSNHLLRPAIGVNSLGKGAIVFTLVGPDYYPSAAFVPIDTFSTGSSLQIAMNGAAPEDGFSGYSAPGYRGVARWGDYSAAVALANGTIWMATEYIPDTAVFPRTQYANWGTYLIKFMP